jgi:hypothetical protein
MHLLVQLHLVLSLHQFQYHLYYLALLDLPDFLLEKNLAHL